MESKIALVLTLREKIYEQMSQGGGEGGRVVNKLYTGRLLPEIQPILTGMVSSMVSSSFIYFFTYYFFEIPCIRHFRPSYLLRHSP